MQIKSHCKNKFYSAPTVDETEYSPIVYERLKKIESYDDLMQDGSSEEAILKALEVPRSTLFRWKKRYREEGLAGLEQESRRPKSVRKQTWTKEMEDNVIALRRQHPWGKDKIAVMYEKTYGKKLSVSMIGRIIKSLVKSGKLQPISRLTGLREVKHRTFDGWAKPWIFGMKAEKPGELIQIDHTNPRLPSGAMIKHFKATCPITKLSFERVFYQATSSNAKDFLMYAQSKFPFSIISVQTDGGSEFMGEFEGYCESQGIEQFVLPPKSPQYNGCVERSNRTIKREFYSLYDGPSNLKDVQASLEKFGIIYNTIRPHKALNYLTPMEYYKKYLNQKAL